MWSLRWQQLCIGRLAYRHDNIKDSNMEQLTGEKPVVCFLGPETSYTHQAALQTFPPEKFELLPVLTIKGF